MRKYLPLLLLAFSVPALAHPGHGTDSFQAGFLHPLTGLAHLLMLTGAGVLSATVLCASFAAGLLLRRHDGLRKTFGGGLIVSALLALMS